MTKPDVMDTFETIKVAVAYKVNGKETKRLPFDIDTPIEPVYKEFKGWKADITKSKTEADLPKELMEYIKFIEKETGVPITIVSVGPNRDATVFRK
jgi:adenylosuccinate synthase